MGKTTKSCWVYFAQPEIRIDIEFRSRPDQTYHLYKIGMSTRVVDRVNSYHVPFVMNIVEAVKFPNVEIARAAELLLKWMYPDYALKKNKGRNISEWFGLDDKQAECVLENLRQFKHEEILNSFIEDASTIIEEHNSFAEEFTRFQIQLRKQNIDYEFPKIVDRTIWRYTQ